MAHCPAGCLNFFVGHLLKVFFTKYLRPAPAHRGVKDDLSFLFLLFVLRGLVAGQRGGDASDDAQTISLAYSESSFYWVGGDNSNGGKGADGTISTGAIAPVTMGPSWPSMPASAMDSPYHASDPSPEPSMPGPV